ncbi:MAG TPA: cupin domain-containing protein [Clostridiaceae bacterium]|nr:cupin domain-containing protein [Clostridiaceae bacterium]
MELGTFIKKIPVRQVVALSDLIEYEPHKISSISLVQKKDLTISLFSLDQGEEMGGHASTGDAMVQVLDGTAEITIDDTTYLVEAGQSIIMPANIQHSLKAVKPYKMLLTVVKP